MTSFSIDSRLLLDAILAIRMENELLQLSFNDDAVTFIVGNESSIRKAILPRNSFVEFRQARRDIEPVSLRPDLAVKFLRLCLKKDSPSLVGMSIDSGALQLSFQDSMQITLPFVQNHAPIEFPVLSVEMTQSELPV